MNDLHIESDPVLKRAKEFGINIERLIENLKRTPEERIERLQRLLEIFEELITHKTLAGLNKDVLKVYVSESLKALKEKKQ